MMRSLKSRLECSAFAFFVFAISRSNIPCVTRCTFASLDLSPCVNDEPKASRHNRRQLLVDYLNDLWQNALPRINATICLYSHGVRASLHPLTIHKRRPERLLTTHTGQTFLNFVPACATLYEKPAQFRFYDLDIKHGPYNLSTEQANQDSFGDK